MNSIDFDIPYIFQVRGIPKRGTKSRMAFFFEKVPVSVQIVDADAAPIAATFKEPISYAT